MCKVSWKSIAWELSCCMRTDGHDEANNRVSQNCETRLKIRTEGLQYEVWTQNPPSPRNTKHSVTLSNAKWPLSDVCASVANSCLLECDAVYSGESDPTLLFRRIVGVRLRLKCDGTRAETRFLLSAKSTSPFKSAGASVQSTTGCRGMSVSGSNAGYTMFRGSEKGTGYTIHSPVSPSFPSRASPCAITFQLDSTAVPDKTSSPSVSRPIIFVTAVWRRKTRCDQEAYCVRCLAIQLLMRR